MRMGFAFCLLLAGCIGPAADVTANGLVLGGPTDPAFAAFAAPFEACVVLARPDNLIDLEANLVDDAQRVWLQVDEAEIDMPAAATGVYAVPDGVGAYPADRVITLHALTDEGESVATLDAPPAPVLALPEAGTHPAGTDLLIDLEGQGFDKAYALVLDATGTVVHDDRPADSEAAIRDLRGADGVVLHRIPGWVLASPGQPYAVALGGIRRARAGDLDGATATGVVVPGA